MSPDTQIQAVKLFVEGNATRGISRLVNVSAVAIGPFLCLAGEAASRFEDQSLRGLGTTRLQCDEMWSLVYARRKNLPDSKRGVFGYGDVWTWTAIDADSKLMISWRMGPRDGATAQAFMRDVSSRLTHRVVLSTDGFRVYAKAVARLDGPALIDHQSVYKIYDRKTRAQNTNYAERFNLTMRMGMRRFMRRTNGFSKNIRRHAAAVGLFFAHYNFCRINKSIRVTPAMEAGLTDHVWSVKELLTLIDGSHVHIPRLIDGEHCRIFCEVCGQEMVESRSDGACSRHCRSSEVHHVRERDVEIA